MSRTVVNVFVTSPDTRSERRLELHTSIGKLKTKLEQITGIPIPNQAISLLNSENDPALVANLSDDSKVLGFYGVRDWQVIKVDDTDPATSFTGQLSDVSQVEKFELSDSAYSERQDTVLVYKKLHKVGRFAPKNDEQPSQQQSATPSVDIPLGSRCEVETTEEGFHKRGTVRFVGETKFGKGGTWVCVEYDEPIGKNDGSVQGERYFTCRPHYGVFVRPDRVKVGDFPVEEIDLVDEDEEM